MPNRFRSLEGKTNKQGIRWKDTQLVWGKLRLDPIIDADNPVQQHGLNVPVKGEVQLLEKVFRYLGHFQKTKYQLGKS